MKGIAHRYPNVFDAAFRVTDPLLVLATTFYFSKFFITPELVSLFKVLAIYGSILVFFIFPFFQLYRPWRGVSLFTEVHSIIKAWIFILVFFNIFILILADDAQRQILWPFCLFKVGLFWQWALFTAGVLILFRTLLRFSMRRLRHFGRNTRTNVIVGAGDLGRRLQSVISENPWVGYQTRAFFDDDQTKASSGPIPVENNLDSIASYVNQHKIDTVFLALPMRSHQRIKEVMRFLNDTTANVFFVPDVFNFHLLSLDVSEVAGLPLINLRDAPLNFPQNIALKWISDKVFSLLILFLISPLLAVIALLVKFTSPGPVIFKQRRYGINGKEIRVYKFRSMTTCDDGACIHQAKKTDPRVTPVGRFLRRTSLDELPQFFNVLQGKMSIVGPRPHAVAHNEQYRKLIDSYMLRHKIKPGITGWAQVNGYRGRTDTLEKMEKRVEHDLYYITNWSLFFDIKIMLMTVFNGFTNKNAY